jgi:hypothetical protein
MMFAAGKRLDQQPAAMTKTLLALSSVALAAALVGCGNGANPSTSASPTVNALDQGVKYAQCMRKNGIQMKDPKPGEGLRIGVHKGDEAKMKAAQKACKAYSPEGLGDHKMTAAELDQQTKLAQCLRRHGIDADDPKPGQPSRIRTRKANEQKLNTAMKTCQKEAGLPDPDSAPPGGSLTQQKG